MLKTGKILGYLEGVMVGAGLLVISLLFYRAFFVVGAEQTAADRSSNSVPSLVGRQVFPPDDPWNTDISSEPVDPQSDELIASIGKAAILHPNFGTVYRGAPIGVPYVIVSGDQPKVPVSFEHAAESDAGPYPIPADVLVEDGSQSNGDRHVIVLDQTHWILYELYRAFPRDGGKRWEAVSGAVFDLNKSSSQRPVGHTSADAAGLAIFPGLVRYDEVVGQRKITHALRFTAERSRRGFIPPAGHFASRNTDDHLPPMGMRVRLKRDFDISEFPDDARVILQALKTYGMILADNGGNWYLSGAPDPRWNEEDIHSIRKVKGADFEIVRMGTVITTLGKNP
ncbi:MAG TPA: hypothetical protein VHD56_08850 [Tepidisphaeraceae bacterium]|nr:hypothetical protein [Tepidisphaeraceae bacterium]